MTTQQSHLSYPKYRSDIDGLRAIAVLSVVAFHAFPGWLRGGFLGVDVFFVISGFLISTIIFENLDRDTFSFSEFYLRRVKRIFPALLLVLVSCFSFAWFALLADEYQQLGKHIGAGAGFVSNLVLWSEGGYFDNAGETKPLLHLWSLGIEEQFYIVWPLLLWLAWKRKVSLLAVTILVAVVSFCLNVFKVSHDTTAAFYSPQTRFWELMSGGLLAWLTIKKHVRGTDGRRLANVLSFAGVFLLAYSFSRIDLAVSFPGWWAVVPVLGAVLLISAGPEAWLNRSALSNRWAVWFGLISFPLYLWHWPLLSFARIVEGEIPSLQIRVAAVILSVLLAWLTYELVEKPIRFGTHSVTRVAALVLSMVGVGLLGLFTLISNGYPSRHWVRSIASSMAGFSEDDPDTHAKCLKMYGLSSDLRYCNVSTERRPRIALIGDSHAAALYKGMAEALAADQRGVLNIGGRLFLDVATYSPGREYEIRISQGGIEATEFAAREESIDTVIMVSRGPFYLEGDWIFRLMSNPSLTDRKKVWDIAMRKTLDLYADVGKQVIFVLDNPELDFDPRKCIQRPFRISTDFHCAVSRAKFDRRNREYREVVRTVLKDYPKVRTFDAAAYLCDEKWCWGKIDGKVLYSDWSHLSDDGSRLIAKELVKVMDGDESKVLVQAGSDLASD